MRHICYLSEDAEHLFAQRSANMVSMLAVTLANGLLLEAPSHTITAHTSPLEPPIIPQPQLHNMILAA